MDSSIIANRVEIGLTKARVIDVERRRRRGKVRTRFLPPVDPKSNVQFRPSLDHRMPTLGNNAVFCLHLNKPEARTISDSRLADLENRPPRHLHQIHAILSKELKRVGKELMRIEKKYYGINKSLSGQLTKYVPIMKYLMNATGVSHLGAIGPLEEVSKQIAVNREKFKDDLVKSAWFKEITNRIKDFIPERFTAIMEHCWKIFRFVDKYCLSFYSTAGDVAVDTVVHYQEQITCWRETIIKNLENILRMSRQIRKDGIKLEGLSLNVRQVGQQHHCSLVPILLAFPESSANIRNASYAMASWIEADENYSTFLRNDVFDLESKREEAMRLMREVRERFHSVTYKLNQTEAECAKLEVELFTLKDKEDLLLDDEQFLASQENEMEVEIGVKETRCAQLRQTNDLDLITYEMCEQLTSEVRSMKEALPFVSRQLSNVRYKLSWIRSRRHALENAQRELEKTLKELEKVCKEKLHKESVYYTIDAKLEISRRIHMFKTTPGAVEKLFYGLSLEPKGSRLTRSQTANDPLTKACGIVADVIEQDWTRLYRSLPFFPLRGRVTVEKDIEDIGREANRMALADHASLALKRWRRFHTRAVLQDLLDSLKLIKRYDVIQEVDQSLNPATAEKSDDEDDTNLPVGPELVPFYRQVERYDKIRAARRAQAAKH